MGAGALAAPASLFPSHGAGRRNPARCRMKGRALIDLPAHGLRCGEYGELPKAVASAYIKAGHFDPKAVLTTEPDAGTASSANANAGTEGTASPAGGSDEGGGGEGAAETELGASASGSAQDNPEA